jgi:hypothetical protein
MANTTVGVDVNVKTNVKGSIGELKALKKQLKETAAGSEDFKRLTNEIDDLEDKLKGSKQAAGDWIDQLSAAPGPLGAVGGALNKLKVSTQTFGGALKATGIGLFVAALGGLIAAFAQSERATKKLQPLLIGFQKIFNGIFAAIEPVFDAFIDLATEALPFVTKGFGVAYSAITSFLQGLGSLGKAVGKLIKGDFTGAWDSAKEAVTGFGKRYDEANKRFIQGTKEVTKTEQEELDKRKEAQEKAAEERKKREEAEAAEEKKRLERQLESRKALLVYTRDEIRKFEKEQAEAEKKRREEKEAQDAINTRKDLLLQVTSAQDVSKALSVITGKNIQDARDQYAALLGFEIESQNLSYQEQEKRYQQIRELERQKLVDRKATQAELDLFDKQSKEQERKRDEAAAEAKAAVISGALGTIADAVGRNTVAGKALSVAQATVDTYAGANKALATYPPPFGGIAAGTVILAGLLNVKKILSTKIPPPPGSQGVSDNTSAPAISNTPPINPGQFIQSSPTLLNAQAIQQLGSATNRAYVLETDVTNSQERIRRINRAARLG